MKGAARVAHVLLLGVVTSCVAHGQPSSAYPDVAAATADARIPAPTTMALAKGVSMVRSWQRLPDGKLYTVNSLHIEDGAQVEYLDPADRGRANPVVYLPAQRTLFGGRSVVGLEAPLGPHGDADLSRWRSTIERIRERFPRATQIIPGVGKPGGRALLSHSLSLIDVELAELSGRFGGG
ncbi:MAG: hypothetical protein JWN48_4501 [Myxococcaceae bacterium]|nr:hypothetical protein [Myxococcaceae bacterium]